MNACMHARIKDMLGDMWETQTLQHMHASKAKTVSTK